MMKSTYTLIILIILFSATSELSACMSTFVLIRCGVDQFGQYKKQVEFLRLNSLPEECSTLPYTSEQCDSILY